MLLPQPARACAILAPQVYDDMTWTSFATRRTSTGVCREGDESKLRLGSSPSQTAAVLQTSTHAINRIPLYRCAGSTVRTSPLSTHCAAHAPAVRGAGTAPVCRSAPPSSSSVSFRHVEHVATAKLSKLCKLLLSSALWLALSPRSPYPTMLTW